MVLFFFVFSVFFRTNHPAAVTGLTCMFWKSGPDYPETRFIKRFSDVQCDAFLHVPPVFVPHLVF